MSKENLPHDKSYKAFFSQPELVESLLQDFVSEPFIGEFDFSTLERLSSDFISADLRERISDVIWRVKWRDSWAYIYIILEFQSSPHYWMAVRMLTYTALLWDDLIRNNLLDKDKKLPPVFPFVLYNGDARWNCATDLAEIRLPVPPELDMYQPKFQYFLLDEKRVAESALRHARGKASYIMRVERAKSGDEILQVARELLEQGRGQEIFPAQPVFLEWLERFRNEIA